MENIVPIRKEDVSRYIADETINGIMEGIAMFLENQKHNRQYWMSSGEVQLVEVPEQFLNNCSVFKVIVVCNNIPGQALWLNGLFIYCADRLNDHEAIAVAQNIAVMPVQTLN